MRAALVFIAQLTILTLVAQMNDTIDYELNGILANRQYQEALDLIDQRPQSPDKYEHPYHYAELLLYKGKAYTHLYRMDDALDTYNSIIEYGQELQDLRIETWGLNSSISLLLFKGEDAQAEKRCKRVLAINSQEDLPCVSDAYTSLSGLYRSRSETDSALVAIRKAIEMDVSLNEIKSVHFNYVRLAEIQEGLGWIDSAIVSLTNGYNYLRPGIDDFKRVSFEVMFANLFLAQHNIRSAKLYAHKAVEHGVEDGVSSKTSDANRILGRIAVYEDSLTLAEVYYRRSLPHLLDRKIALRLVWVYSDLAMIKTRNNEMGAGRLYLDSAAYWVSTLSGDVEPKAFHKATCEYELAAGNIRKAQLAFTQFKGVHVSGNSLYADISAMQLESSLREAQGRYRQALVLRASALSIRDSLFRSEQVSTVNEMEARFNKAENDRKIADLDAEKQISAIAIEQKNLLLWGGAIMGVLLLALGLFLIAQYRKIQRVNVKVEEQNDELAQTLAERELLLKEIHHRVKNNLQVISSLLSLQSREIKDDSALQAVNESRNRVKSMALIHQNLYKENDVMGVDMRDYVSKLSRSLVNNYKVDSGKVEVHTDIDALNLDVDTTIPLGLILNELLSNVLKYAFPEGRSGTVKIRLKEQNKQLLLEVVDNGVGIDPKADHGEKSSGFGMRMIKTFSKKLKADHEVINDNGTTVRLTIRKFKLAS